MRKARYQYVAGRPKPHKVSYWRDNGARAAKFFAQEGDALLFQAQLNEQKQTDLPDNLTLSVDERIIFSQIRSLCKKSDVSLEEALDCLKENLADYVANFGCVGCNFATAMEKYLVDLERRGARIATIQFYKSKLNLFKRREAPENVKDITTERAERYLASILSPEHAKRALRAFFGFCEAQKWVASNPFKAAKTPRILKEAKTPDIITPADCKTFLCRLPDPWKPAAALMAFAGIRPLEVVSADRSPVLTVANVDFTTKRISIPANVSKTRRLRILSELPPNIWKWLEPLKSPPHSQSIAPASYGVWRSVKDKTGVKIPHDALRHSFASYAYHFLGAEHTVEIMGHIGGFGVFAKHYKGLASPSEAKKFFAIMP